MTVYELHARQLKALKIADRLAIEVDGWADEDVALLADEDAGARDDVASVVGVNPPSDETWRMAIEMVLRRRDVARERGAA